MGYLKERHGMMMLRGIPKEGQCAECGVFHEPEQPHNRDALRYQYTFYDTHGRWPSWADAMSHCADDVKAIWRHELERVGVDVGEEPEMSHVDLTIKVDDGSERESDD